MTIKVQNNHRWARCPLCNAKAVFRIGTIEYQNPLRFSTQIIQLTEMPELWKCSECRSCFTQNVIQEKIAKSLYAICDSGDRWPSTLFEQEKTTNTIKCLSKLFLPGKKILDIGCNTGELLDYAKSKGCQSAGLEFSATSRDVLERKGIRSFASFDEIDDLFDIVTAFDLLEHLYNVPEFLDRCKNILAPNGYLVILTGNVSSFSARFTGATWWYTQFPEHIVFPSKKYFLNISGYEVISWIPTYASMSFIYPITQFMRAICNSVLKWSYTGLPSFRPDHVLAVLKNE
jgi:2-polyprenyl-3-methyl-5-hydroxy-6-metoxy-1,4-benzoquinol methylase